MGNSEKWKGEITRSFIKNLNRRIGYHSGMLKNPTLSKGVNSHVVIN